MSERRSTLPIARLSRAEQVSRLHLSDRGNDSLPITRYRSSHREGLRKFCIKSIRIYHEHFLPPEFFQTSDGDIYREGNNRRTHESFALKELTS